MAKVPKWRKMWAKNFIERGHVQVRLMQHLSTMSVTSRPARLVNFDTERAPCVDGVAYPTRGVLAQPGTSLLSRPVLTTFLVLKPAEGLSLGAIGRALLDLERRAVDAFGAVRARRDAAHG
jgi:hypothetical protein